MPVALLGDCELSLKNRFFLLFDDFWTFVQFSQKRPVILPSAELMPTPTLFEYWPARAAIMFCSLKHNLKFKFIAWSFMMNLFQPQNSMPDVVIWMISGESRVAYLRIPAYDVLYSEWEWGRGRYCGKKQTIFLKVCLQPRSTNFWSFAKKNLKNFSNTLA